MAKKVTTGAPDASTEAATPPKVEAAAPLESDRGPGEETRSRSGDEPSSAPNSSASLPDPVRRDASRPTAGALLGAGLLGGVIGVGLLAAGLIWLAPLSDLSDRVGAAETALGQSASRRALEAAERRIGAAEGRLETLKTEIETRLAGAAPPPVDLVPFAERIGRFDQALSAGRERMDRIEKVLSERPSGLGPEAARLSVAVLLRDRLRVGSAVGSELAALEALGADGGLLAPLRPFARTAPPAPQRLAADFEAIAPAIVKAGGAEAGVGDRLAAALTTAVRIRRLDEPAMQSPADVLDEIRTALRADRVSDAERLWKSLPSAARDASRSWHQALEQRGAALSGADALVAAAVDRAALAARSAGSAR
jgi:hypothetical protein